MFSVEKAIRRNDIRFADLSDLASLHLEPILRKHELCAGMICTYDDGLGSIDLLASVGIPRAPFTGTRKEKLASFVHECLERYPAPHVHSVVRSELWAEISAVVSTTDWQPHVLFLPFYVRNRPLIILCFRKAGDPLSSTKEGLSEDLGVAADVTAFLFGAHTAENNLRVMEVYIKEIGHDIASSVQATIAKLRNVSRGLVDGPAVLKKVREAEEEIMATYRIAETLGITVDPDYRLVNPGPFDAVEAAKQVIVRCQSEATERHIQLRLEQSANLVVTFGDEKAVQSALTQLLMNAIKYAKGSSYVTVRVREEQGHVEFSVTDRGVPIDKDEEPNLWEFGFRGRRALELHVNGSGIGLYTVKKIALAHGGRYWCTTAHDLESIVTFAFTIPTKKPEVRKARPLYSSQGI